MSFCALIVIHPVDAGGCGECGGSIDSDDPATSRAVYLADRDADGAIYPPERQIDLNHRGVSPERCYDGGGVERKWGLHLACRIV